MSGFNDIFHLRQLAASPDFQLATVRFHQPRRRFQPRNQRFSAAIKNDARALATQTGHPVCERFRAHAGRQATAYADHIELAQPAQRIVNKTLPVARRHFKAGEVEVGDFAIFLSQLDVDTGTALNDLKTVCDAQFTEQLLKTILIVFTEETANGDVDTGSFSTFATLILPAACKPVVRTRLTSPRSISVKPTVS